MTKHANPDEYFAISLSLAAVSRSDYAAVEAAMRRVRDEFCRGGSGINVENVRPDTVINR